MSHAGALVVYSPMGTKVSYLGRLVEYTPDSGTLILQGCLILARTQEQGVVEFHKVPHASRESYLYLRTSDVPGTLIINPEEETVKRYEEHVIKTYSKLALF